MVCTHIYDTSTWHKHTAKPERLNHVLLFASRCGVILSLGIGGGGGVRETGRNPNHHQVKIVQGIPQMLVMKPSDCTIVWRVFYTCLMKQKPHETHLVKDDISTQHQKQHRTLSAHSSKARTNKQY
jgi:hypothetical protein